MKPHPEMTIDDILEGIRSSTPEGLSKVSGPPDSAEEKVAAFEGLKKALEDIENKIQVQCVGCDQPTKIRECTPCECGQFVCHPCRVIEGDEECKHDPSPFMEEGD